jgi:GT2 family glycosyltransferase
MPPGSRLEWINGSANIAANRNLAVEAMRGEWLWMLDDDMLFPPDTLTRLLAHFRDPAVEIVVPHCLRRHQPYETVLLEVRAMKDEHHPPRVIQVDERGLIAVYAAGAAGMLVRRRVFDRIAGPWFENGQIDGRHLQEDTWFCYKAQDAGCRVWCDVDTSMGHMFSVAVWPARTAEGWSPQAMQVGVNTALANSGIVIGCAAKARSVE